VPLSLENCDNITNFYMALVKTCAIPLGCCLHVHAELDYDSPHPNLIRQSCPAVQDILSTCTPKTIPCVQPGLMQLSAATRWNGAVAVSVVSTFAAFLIEIRAAF
jgi:hypothetical protein